LKKAEFSIPSTKSRKITFENKLIAGEFVCTKCRKPHDEDVPCGTNINCPTCKGSGWLYDIKPNGDIDGGKVAACTAPNCHGDYFYKRIPGIDYMGVVKEQSFDSFKISEDNQNVFSASKSLANGESDYWLLVIYGVTGNGKSHLANSAALQLQRAGQVVKKMTMLDLLEYLHAGMDNGTLLGRINEIKYIPFLVIDDLKVEYLKSTDSSWNLEHIEQIINYRLEARLPTMITTNNTPDVLPERIRSRFERIGAKMFWNKAQAYKKNNKK
jgi:DNA replication protein DnaC